MAKMRVRQQDGTVAEINLGKFAVGSGEACVVDQTYNSESENAQSGIAVAEAIEAALENVPSGGASFDSTAVNEYIDEKFEDLQENGISVIKTTNGQTLRFFVGTQAAYNALENKDNLFAIISDDTTKENLLQRLQELENGVGINEDGIESLGARLDELWGNHMSDIPYLASFHDELLAGTKVVGKAEYAIQANSALFATEAEFVGRAEKAENLEVIRTTTSFGSGNKKISLDKGCVYAITAGYRTFILFLNDSSGTNDHYSNTVSEGNGTAYRLRYNHSSGLYIEKQVDDGAFNIVSDNNGTVYIAKIASTIGG